MANVLLDHFRKIPKEGLSSGTLLTLYYLCDLANKESFIAFPSIATIAKEIGLSPKQVRRHTHCLVEKGLIKIVANKYGGEKGMTCHYKITLPAIPKQEKSFTFKGTTPIEDHPPSHTRVSTPPTNGSQTVFEPKLTYVSISKKYGFGWNKDPDKAYLVGRELGINAHPGEQTSEFVARIFAKINAANVCISQ
jgi:DNA-binding Lrp family transcriptional regulator